MGKKSFKDFKKASEKPKPSGEDAKRAKEIQRLEEDQNIRM